MNSVEQPMSSKGKELPLDIDTRPITPTTGALWAVEKRMVRALLRALNDPPIAIRVWDGQTFYRGQSPPEVTLRVRDRRALWQLTADPDLYFGDAYSTGRIVVEGDLLNFVQLVSRSLPQSGGGWLSVLRSITSRAPRTNTLHRSRRNIHHHYDLSNKFYTLWLDSEYLQYTCAYFPTPAATLEQAQIAKLHHVCRKLGLKPGDEVVEAGCGWGGLGLFMAKHYGANVRAYNISHEQIVFATNRAKDMGVEDRVVYIEDDYRNISGTYDKFVSVGMLEHVGVANYKSLGHVIHRCLRESGCGLIHSIGRNRPRLMNAWIEKRIFPGAYPPTLKEMTEIFEGHDFSILDVENLRLHYAKTLEHWLERFNAVEGRVREMFDERFVKAWRLYLTGSISAFLLGELQLFQIVFNRGANNEFPLTREHLYQTHSSLNELHSK